MDQKVFRTNALSHYTYLKVILLVSLVPEILDRSYVVFMSTFIKNIDHIFGHIVYNPPSPIVKTVYNSFTVYFLYEFLHFY